MIKLVVWNISARPCSEVGAVSGIVVVSASSTPEDASFSDGAVALVLLSSLLILAFVVGLAISMGGGDECVVVSGVD